MNQIRRYMLLNERDARHESVMSAARQMMIAARTAPKGKGIDVIEIMVVDGEEKALLSKAMREISGETGFKFFLRDADNVDESEAVMLVGTTVSPMGLNCGRCGFAVCGERPESVPCAINTVDVGIAVGSAVSTASDLKLDTRVMFSIGQAALRLGWPASCNNTLGIAISASSKSPFFDRKPKEEQK